VVSYNSIIYMLNNIHYNIRQNFNVQENLSFSNEHKENLEFHLKQDLNNYLAPIYNSQQSMFDNNTTRLY